MRISRIILPLSIVAAAALWAAAHVSKPSVVACVDLEKIYRSIDMLKAADSRSVALRTELQSRVDKLSDELRSMQEELESFQPGSAAHNDAMNKTILKAGDLAALQSFAELKMESERANAVRDAYLKVRSTCGALAQEQGIDVVLIDDTIPPVTPANLEGTMQQINGRRMLYSNPALDITDLLVERMNGEFRAANPSFVPPAPEPSTGTAPAAAGNTATGKS